VRLHRSKAPTSSDHWNIRSARVIRTFLFFILLVACTGASGRPGQAAEPPFELGLVTQDGRISAELPSATDITLRLRGVWRDACLPRLVGFSGSGHRRLLTLEVPGPGQVCAQVLTPFELDIPGVRFEVEEAGLVEVALVEAGAAWLASSVLSVQPEPQSSRRFSLHDVSGSWFNPDRSGSGLILSHLRAGPEERVVGGWMNYSPDGQSQWYLLADARWVTPDRLVGTAYRASTAPFACTLQFPNFECDFEARTATAIQAVAKFELSMIDADRAALTFGEPSFVGSPPLIIGYRVELERL
jgi:hypothetical protein